MSALRYRSLQSGIISLVAQPIGSGAEGRVHAVDGDAHMVGKVYLRHPGRKQVEKLEAMIAAPVIDPMVTTGHRSIAWPRDLLIEQASGRVAGFVMPRIPGGVPFHQLYSAAARRARGVVTSYGALVVAARNTASAIAALHRADVMIGDVSHSNVLADPGNALVSIIDTDSFAVREASGHVHSACAATIEFAAPEVLEIIGTGKMLRFALEPDRWALAVLVHRLVTEGRHPFDGSYIGGSDVPDHAERVRRGWYPGAGVDGCPVRPGRKGVTRAMLDPRLLNLFDRTFAHGHRDPSARVDAGEWMGALDDAITRVVSCTAVGTHQYFRHLGACPWCASAHDPFPPATRPARAIRRFASARHGAVAGSRVAIAGTAMPPAQVMAVAASGASHLLAARTLARSSWRRLLSRPPGGAWLTGAILCVVASTIWGTAVAREQRNAAFAQDLAVAGEPRWATPDSAAHGGQMRAPQYSHLRTSAPVRIVGHGVVGRSAVVRTRVAPAPAQESSTGGLEGADVARRMTRLAHEVQAQRRRALAFLVAGNPPAAQATIDSALASVVPLLDRRSSMPGDTLGAFAMHLEAELAQLRITADSACAAVTSPARARCRSPMLSTI